jgi:hypothetical protein
MNERSQRQEGKNWILPKETNANRFFRDSHRLEIYRLYKSVVSSACAGPEVINGFYPKQGLEKVLNEPLLTQLVALPLGRNIFLPPSVLFIE